MDPGIAAQDHLEEPTESEAARTILLTDGDVTMALAPTHGGTDQGFVPSDRLVC
jgi:hypothetical protein